MIIDTSFDMYSDTPAGKDPDSHSPTLRRYHQILWSKPLPTGELFALTTAESKSFLHHTSAIGDFLLASDAITHSYRSTKRMAHIIDAIPEREVDELFLIGSTIGAYTIFPANRRNGKATINGARGMHPRIGDRFDLTLECIRRHYLRLESPLSEVLSRYADFFDLFVDFRGYVEFFNLQDLVSADASNVTFWLPFSQFEGSAYPANFAEYRTYRDNVISFVRARNSRINVDVASRNTC